MSEPPSPLSLPFAAIVSAATAVVILPAAEATRCSASMLSPESPAMLPCLNRRVSVS